MTRLLLGLAVFVSVSVHVPGARPAIAQSSTALPGFQASLETITALLNRGRGIEAENVARALLARVENVLGRDAREVADVLDLLGRAVRRSSRVKNEEKRAFAERAVAIREKVSGPAHPDLATSLINLGVQRTLEGDPSAARPLLERALAIRETAFGPDHPIVTGALQSLAGLLMTLHDDEGAKVLLERAQQSDEKAHGLANAATIRTLVNLAILYQETGDYVGARQRYERARIAAGSLGDSPDLLTLHVLAGTAVVLSELAGDPAGAATLNERLLALSEQSYGAADLRLRVPLEHLAMDRRDLGDYAAALTAGERSLAIAERTLGPRHPEVARSLHTVATIHAALGDYAAAMRLFERASRINEEVLPPSRRESARASSFIRELLPLSGYGPDETDLFEQVLALREKQRGLGDPRTAESLSTLAAMLSTPADYQRTRALFTRALDAQERFLGPDHPEVGAAATNLANVLARTSDGDKAEQLYQRAVRIWEVALGANHPKVATGLANLAGHYLRAGNAIEARPLLARALAIQEKALGSAHPDVAATLSRQAEVYARTGATAEAFASASRAEIISREHLRLTVRILPERQALAYASSLPANVGLMLRLAATRPDDREMITRAWDAVVRARGIVFDEMAARRSVAAGEGSHIQALATAVTSARQRLATLAVRGVRNDAPARHRQLLDHARAEKERAERDLAEHSARFREDESKRSVLLRNVSAALPAGAALIAFVKAPGSANDPDVASASPAQRSSKASYFALVLSPGESRPALVALGSADTVEALILQWRKQIDQEAMAAGRSARRSEAAYRRVAGELRNHVWDRLSPHLSKAARVFIVPDGALHLVSFAALPAAASGYLIETGPVIHYLSTERDLVPAEARPATGHGLLALGGAEFDRSDVTSAADGSFRGTRQGCPDFERVRFEPLPASLEEVDDVMGLWDQAHRDAPPRSGSAMRSREALRLTGAAASESSLKAEATGRRILHLATHGFFLGSHCGPAVNPSAEATTSTPAKILRDNPLLMSGLILAGANRRMAAEPGEEDGVLTAEEVAALDLGGVEWAVLSGCDTGIGEVRSGEGVFGLRRAFQEAGARTVIMTLWPVEDQATRLWMSTLYRGRLIEHLSTADSVRAAGLAIVRDRRAKGVSSHPFYWGAFVAAGDWR